MASQFAVIIPAAGQSRRFGKSGAKGLASKKKTFTELKGRAVWLRSVDCFANRDDVKQIVLVVSAEDMQEFKERYRADLAFLDIELVEGGKERADSVANGVAAVREEIDYIAVHDAARPLLADEWITNVFQAAEKSGAAILATPVTSTLKRAQETTITETVCREHLWMAQTPQVAKAEWLRSAFAKRDQSQPTDEAQLLEQAGYPVSIVECSAINQKITTMQDFKMAEALLGVVPKKKGLDALHPFADDEGMNWA